MDRVKQRRRRELHRLWPGRRRRRRRRCGRKATEEFHDRALAGCPLRRFVSGTQGRHPPPVAPPPHDVQGQHEDERQADAQRHVREKGKPPESPARPHRPALLEADLRQAIRGADGAVQRAGLLPILEE